MNDLSPMAPAIVEPTHLTTRYERAMYYLAEAVRVDEVMHLRDEAEQIRLLGRQAKDKTLQADAVELQMRSERKLGELLIAAREAGQLGTGRMPKAEGNGSMAELFPPRISLEQAGIDKKLSMKAQALAKGSEAVFEDVVRMSRDKILAGKAVVINPIKDVTKRAKQLKRQIKEAQLAARQLKLPDEQFGVIYADPEWKFETWSAEGLDRGAENHYPTSELSVIKSRPVGTLAANDCVLFLWATVPMLPQALEVMRFWGFDYKSHFAWDKIDAGTGYWNRNQHELLLVGTRGNIPCPAPGTQYPSLISSRKGVHSEKPDWAYELIEEYFPNLPKLELNARRRRDGWKAWGLEAPEDEAAPVMAEAGAA